MWKAVLKVIKCTINILLSILKPLRNIIRLKHRLPETNDSELVSVETEFFKFNLQISNNKEMKETEMISWNAWDEKPIDGLYQSLPGDVPNINVQRKDKNTINAMKSPVEKAAYVNKYQVNQKQTDDITEPDVNFFEDMAPEVIRQPKIFIRKKETVYSSFPVSNRLTVMSDLPLAHSELEAWEDQANAWDVEDASEDLTWKAQEAIREKRRKERQERQMEQLKKKQSKEANKGIKSTSLAATKLS
ncbi:receptor-binding cancer antigen expressed on SiSo cells-like [Physella acuta]|uniref:receptor-binding cancer antigen expressed on SiSo cells-like n=1 Tax=Physella acuta TaxID=109671 RepID=UPI0027DC484E|nr:receptor-binding cancer antigen expressed on SiSo cells-like [Physella acuta]XP_059177844.1 receptor-binding cancer antigen expressed on SiSo cells-like [Physella acuta]XP_059177846.1 receptor-binding cancer antigen expressed on SiSo cells-like [Physella acuta]XP_059177847.1 receptor-binding cancer antigen expressed on SiSo cells-like [Physella acuta]XP_059177848.1 receptor-binding cancer antigen expressed on SiSo cells-like [Physella acuta]XP_059177849.1 receptor-binding cancer antigen exp